MTRVVFFVALLAGCDRKSAEDRPTPPPTGEAQPPCDCSAVEADRERELSKMLERLTAIEAQVEDVIRERDAMRKELEALRAEKEEQQLQQNKTELEQKLRDAKRR